jgi:hypothetical protein
MVNLMGVSYSAWSDIAALRSTSSWFQALSIALVFLSGLLQVGKYVVDRRERTLSAAAESERLNPVAQPILTATATVEVAVQSAKLINKTYTNRGGYVVFGRKGAPLLVLTTSESRAWPTGSGEVSWRGVFNMDVADTSIGKPVRSLHDADILQISFDMLPPNSDVNRGLAVVTINSSVRIEIPIQPQKMLNEQILVPGIARYLTELK